MSTVQRGGCRDDETGDRSGRNVLQTLRRTRGAQTAALDGVTGAKANFKKGIIFVETVLPDDALAACVNEAGFKVTRIRDRRGLFD